MIAQTSDTPIYPDEYIDDCGRQFVELGLRHYGITFLQFLANPRGFEGFEPVDGYLPLLPEQERVRQRLAEDLSSDAEQQLERDCPEVACRGGALLEPLHHHAHGYDRRRSMFRRQGGAS